jgi:hypothetical protein
MTGGDFTQEAYEALRSAYADQLSTQDEQELAGVQVMGQKLTMETLPVDSPWRDKISPGEYPTGKSAYTDGPQKTPEEILEIMREAAADRDAAQASSEEEDLNVDDMSDEELDALLSEILDEDEAEDGLSDEELDAIIAEVEEEEAEEEAQEEEEEEAEEEAEEEEEEAEVEEEEEDEEKEEEVEVEDVEETQDANDIASEIAALREELEGLKFN